jgi:acyl dehydratase
MAGQQPSTLRAAMRLVAAGIRERWAPATSPPVAPGRKLAVERRGIIINLTRVRRYLDATRGSALYQADGSEVVIPPTYPSVWETALTLELLALVKLPFPSAGVIRIRDELVGIRPMRVHDRFRCRVELERIEPHPRGTRLSLKCRSWNAAGQLCQENATEILMQSRSRRTDGESTLSEQRRPAREMGEGHEAQWREHSKWDIDADAGLRFARASGDFNPAHLWSWTARLVGFSRPILHGHCSLAMIVHQLGRPATEAGKPMLRSIAAEFRSPLALPAAVRLMVASESGGSAQRFRLEDATGRAGQRPYIEGSYLG